MNGILWTYFCSDCSRQIKFWLVHDKQFSLYTFNLHLVLIPIVVFTFNRPVKIWCFTVQVNKFEIWNSLIVFFCICGNIRMFRYISPNWWTLSMHWDFIAPKSISSQIVGLRQKLHKTHLCNRLYWLILTRCWISLELNYPWIMNLWTALHRISINAKWNESDLVYR